MFGLLGGANDHDTIYTLPSDTVLPQSAIVVDGQSEYRKNNPQKRSHSRDEIDVQPERKPARKKPAEGKAKDTEEPIKKRKSVKK
jgi:hypothetical protein